MACSWTACEQNVLARWAASQLLPGAVARAGAVYSEVVEQPALRQALHLPLQGALPSPAEVCETVWALAQQQLFPHVPPVTGATDAAAAAVDAGWHWAAAMQQKHGSAATAESAAAFFGAPCWADGRGCLGVVRGIDAAFVPSEAMTEGDDSAAAAAAARVGRLLDTLDALGVPALVTGDEVVGGECTPRCWALVVGELMRCCKRRAGLLPPPRVNVASTTSATSLTTSGSSEGAGPVCTMLGLCVQSVGRGDSDSEDAHPPDAGTEKEVAGLLALRARLAEMLRGVVAELGRCGAETAALARQHAFARDAEARYRVSVADAARLVATLEGQAALEDAATARVQATCAALAAEQTRLAAAAEAAERAAAAASARREALVTRSRETAARRDAAEATARRAAEVRAQLDAEQRKRAELAAEADTLAARLGAVAALVASLEGCRAELAQHCDERCAAVRNRAEVLGAVVAEGRRRVDALAAENEALRTLGGEAAVRIRELREAVAAHGSQAAGLEAELARTHAHIAELREAVTRAEAESAKKEEEEEKEEDAGASPMRARRKQEIEQRIEELHQRALALGSGANAERLRAQTGTVRQQETDIRALQARIAAKEAALRATPPPKSGRGTLLFPALLALLVLVVAAVVCAAVSRFT